MDLKKKVMFENENKDKMWEDKCNYCCILKCGLFADFEKQCHCGNFTSRSCKECKHKDLQH